MNWQWQQCVPTIKAAHTDPGIVDVFWDQPAAESLEYVRGYNVSPVTCDVTA